MTLAGYLHGVLGGLASQLNWSVEANSYGFIVSEALESYGVSIEVEATNLKKLHALGKVALWKAVMTEVSFDYDVSMDGSSYKRSGMFEMAKQKLADALTDSISYLPEYVIEVGTVTFGDDPYNSSTYELG